MGLEDAFHSAIEAAKDLVPDSVTDALADVDDEIAATVGLIEEAELADHYLQKDQTELTEDNQLRICELALETGDPNLLISLSEKPNLSFSAIRQITEASHVFDQSLDRGDTIRLFSQLNKNPLLAEENFKKYQMEAQNVAWAPLYLVGLPDHLAQQAYAVDPQKYAETFPGSPLLTGEEIQKAVDKSTGQFHELPPNVALAVLYGEGTETGLMNRRDLTPAQRTQIGEALLSIELDQNTLSDPKQVKALDQLLRQVADHPATVTPNTFVAIVEKFATSYRGFASPDTIRALAERAQQMHANKRISDSQYQELRGQIRDNMNLYLAEDQKVPLRNIFQQKTS